MTLKLKIIVTSTRPNRVGPTIANWVADEARSVNGFEVEIVDLAEIALPFLDEPGHPITKNYEHEHTKRWSAIVDEADAVVFVTPEYDSFPPATAVNAIQVLFREWGYKPAGIVSYGGVSGGLRAAQALRQLLGNLGAVAIPQVVPIPFFPEHVSENGFDATDKMREGAGMMFSELAKWGEALKPLREAA